MVIGRISLNKKLHHNKSEVELQTGFQIERSLRSLFLPALLPVEHPDRPLGDGVVLEDVLAVVLELDVLGAGGHDAGDVPVPALRLVPLHDLSLGLVRTAGPHVPCTQQGCECTDFNELSSWRSRELEMNQGPIFLKINISD